LLNKKGRNSNFDLLSCPFPLLLGIGLITIISQTYTAALENPAKNLKIE
jgi:hypothetical protein